MLYKSMIKCCCSSSGSLNTLSPLKNDSTAAVIEVPYRVSHHCHHLIHVVVVLFVYARLIGTYNLIGKNFFYDGKKDTIFGHLFQLI